MNSKQHNWRLRIAIPLWWLFFAIITSSLSLASFVTKGNSIEAFSFKANFIWQFGWIIWGILTFAAIALARKYPIEKQRLKTGLFRHFLFGLVFVAVHIAIEYAINAPFRFLLGLEPQSNQHFLVGLIAYKSHINFIIYFAIVGATVGYDNYLRYQTLQTTASQLEAKLAQSELQSLKMQLHPHFLFNTHHSIISLMLKEENDKAIEMLTQLSDLLRITLRKNDLQKTSLKEELDTLELYLDIQKVRFKDRLRVQIIAPPKTLQAAVPYLLLQPIVENAIQHGIDNLTQDGLVSIEIKKREDQLEISVSDNGPGMDLSHGYGNGNGIGLKNTMARLQQLYHAENSLTIDSSPEIGTKVHISFPYEVFTMKKATPQ